MSIQNVASWSNLQKDWNRLKDVHLNELFLENPKVRLLLKEALPY